MKPILSLTLIVCFTLIGCSTSRLAQDAAHPEHPGNDSAQDLRVIRLLQSDLTGVDGKEVVMSHVTISPNAILHWHWHPGEEFAYILEGTVILTLKDQPRVVYKKGDVGKVPFKHVHTAEAGELGAEILVFRVHEVGQPERVLVE